MDPDLYSVSRTLAQTLILARAHVCLIIVGVAMRNAPAKQMPIVEQANFAELISVQNML